MTDRQQKALSELKTLALEDDQAALLPPCEAECPGCPGATPISTRAMTDEQLISFLKMNRWDVKRTAYQVLIYKSEASEITLSSGLKLPDQSEYYKRLARMYRPNHGGMLHRVDDPKRGRGRA